MLRKNDRVEVEILRYGSNGEGIGVCDGQTIFLPYTIAGEKVLAHIVFAKKNFAIAKAVEILQKSPQRQTPVCPLFGRCGGCTMQHISYEEQCKIKGGDVVQTFKKVADINLEGLQVVHSPKEFGYRNKMSVPFSMANGKAVCGFYQSGTHSIVEMKKCPLQTEVGNRMLEEISAFVAEFNIEGYCELSSGKGRGLLRHVVLRTVKEGVMVVLCINGSKVPHMEKLYARLQKISKNIGLYININRENTNVIFGEKFVHKCGVKFIEAEKNSIKFPIGAESFLQVNDDVVDMLYTEAVEKAEITSEDIVVNCYSGTGFLSAMFAKTAKKVVGIEIVEEATQLACKLAEDNGLASVMENITGDVEVEFAKIMKKTRANGKNVVLVLDPPRKGVDFSTLEKIKSEQPKRIVYISCNPQTLARDCGILMSTLAWTNGLNEREKVGGNCGSELKKTQNQQSGYRITHKRSFDMFPQTGHVETLVVLERE